MYDEIIDKRCGYDNNYIQKNGKIVGKDKNTPCLILKYDDHYKCNLCGFEKYESSNVTIYIRSNNYRICYSCKTTDNEDRNHRYNKAGDITAFCIFCILIIFPCLITACITVWDNFPSNDKIFCNKYEPLNADEIQLQQVQ